MSTHSHLQTFAAALSSAFSNLSGAEPEAQLSTPTENLVTLVAGELKSPATLRRETRAAGGRPDFGVEVGGALCGYLELKAPGLGARPHLFKDRNKEQWKKFASLPNLIYTDGNEWTLLRDGQTIGQTVRLAGDVRSDGAAAATPENAQKLEALLRDFLSWQPIVPSKPRELAAILAPLCRLIRADVLAAVEDSNSGLHLLAQEWRRTLFPEADDLKFADSYAQTLTYGLLLARVEGAGTLTIESAAQTLDANHNLLAEAVRVLGQPAARAEIGAGLDVLLRVLNALGGAVWNDKNAGKDDPWLYFYEDFLAAYDPKLRKDAGVYYTPHQVIGAQVRLIAEVLRTRLGKTRGFNAPDVTVLDPAAGTGAYPLAVMDWAYAEIKQTHQKNPAFVSGEVSALAGRMFAFEFLVGPYAVAHLRLTQAVKAAGGTLPAPGAPVFLCDTLESPFTSPAQTQLFTRRLSQEHERARQIKAGQAVWVCLGNPPYDRQTRTDAAQTRKGGWIRAGEGTIENPRNAPLDDFLQPARQSGKGNYLANLYNDYVYFWRFALWKVFESLPANAPSANDGGIVCFITASSYLRGPGFVGMRQMMRETFDELWILDLEGDKLGARKTDGVFNITVGTCIALGVKKGAAQSETPAQVRYHKITGTTAEKFAQLDAIQALSDVAWLPCPDDWQAPFLPRTGNAVYWDCPLLTDLFPWQLPGVKWHRTWPIGETEELLRARWSELMKAQGAARGALFRETTSRQIANSYTDEINDGARLASIQSLPPDAPPPPVQRYGFRSFDRQWILNDPRLCDRMRPTLWKSYGPQQIFFTGLTSEIYGDGPALTATPYIPDLHHFRGSFGGKHIIPLWRDANATQANVTAGVLEQLSALYGRPVKAPDLFAAVYALLFPRAYVERFADELLIPGPRVPLPAQGALFQRAAALGHQLIRLHTWNERDLQNNAPTHQVAPGNASYQIPVSPAPDDYPAAFAYDASTQTLRVGDGEFGQVAPEVWNYSVSGLPVVESWLKYRMKAGAGRASSELDKLRPASWSDQLSRELQELLWTLEASLELEPQCAALLEEVLAGDLVGAADLPAPTEAERRAPGGEDSSEQMALLEAV